MNAVELLIRCRAAGIDLAAGAGGSLCWEADDDPPADLLEALAALKADVLAVLSAHSAPLPPVRPSKPSKPSNGPEGAALMDDTLAGALSLIDLLASRVQAPALHSLLELYRAVARRYHAELHPLLFEVGSAVLLLARDWGFVLPAPTPIARTAPSEGPTP